MPVFGSTKSAAPPPKPPAAARRKSDAGADLLWQAQLNADAKRDEDASQLCALGAGGVEVACAAARAADAAFVSDDAALGEASSSLVDGEPVVQGVRCRARISY